MNTGIFYLYEFKDTHKLRNTGFLKLTKQEHTCFLQFHARSVPVTSQDSSMLSAFYLNTETITAKQLCKIPCLDQTISDKVIVSELDFPSKHTLNEIDGFFLELPNGIFLAAMSPNICFDSQKILYTADEIKPAITEQPAASEPPTISEQPDVNDFLAAMSPNICFDSQKILYTADEIKPAITEQPAASEPPTISEQPDVNEPPTISEQPDASEPPIISEQPDANEPPTISELPAAALKTVRKIQRRELTCLPRHYWNLANNSFLLHGYYNYNHLLLVEEDGHYWLGVPGIYDPKEAHAAELFGFSKFTSFLLHGYYNYNHLLLVEEDGHYWLGVPGIYDPKEAHAAELFGFSKFTDAYNQQLELSDDECSIQGTFGYWCRFLR